METSIVVQWWHLIVFTGLGMAGVLLAVILGGWLVFKTKTITMPTPFIDSIRPQKSGASNYLPKDLGEMPQDTDDEISSAAARLRAQKAEAPKDGKDRVMAFVRGSK